MSVDHHYCDVVREKLRSILEGRVMASMPEGTPPTAFSTPPRNLKPAVAAAAKQGTSVSATENGIKGNGAGTSPPPQNPLK